MRMICLLGLSLSVSNAVAATDCKRLYEEHLKSDMGLTYEQFDQAMDGGFRTVANQGCSKEAADLIEVYVRENGATENSLRWHIAQLRAAEGNVSEAIKYAKRSLLEKEDFSKEPLRWNDYVLATIAFLEKDRAALMLHRDKVADGKDAYWGNALNLKLLDSLIKYFDKDYKYATSRIES